MFVTVLHSICYLDILLHIYESLQVVFIEPQILNFERSLNLPRGPKAVLFRIAKFLLETLLITIQQVYDS